MGTANSKKKSKTPGEPPVPSYPTEPPPSYEESQEISVSYNLYPDDEEVGKPPGYVNMQPHNPPVNPSSYPDVPSCSYMYMGVPHGYTTGGTSNVPQHVTVNTTQTTTGVRQMNQSPPTASNNPSTSSSGKFFKTMFKLFTATNSTTTTSTSRVVVRHNHNNRNRNQRQQRRRRQQQQHRARARRRRRRR